MRELTKKLEEFRGSAPRSLEVRTLRHLVERWKAEHAFPAVYDKNGVRVAGMRSWKTTRTRADRMLCFAGDVDLDAIDYTFCSRLRRTILQTPTRYRKPRSAADANRLMELLRSILNFAVDNDIMTRNPMEERKRQRLVVVADERLRERVITDAEEHSLLRCAAGGVGGAAARRAHMPVFAVCMLDLGTRPSELLNARWEDVDFTVSRDREGAVVSAGTLTIVTRNTKTSRERKVDLTPRVAAALKAWRRRVHVKPLRDPELIFGGIRSVKTAWNSIRREAGIPDVRIYDQRHTTATRLVEDGMELSQVGRILGHTNPTTTYRYANGSQNTRQRAATILARRASAAQQADDHETRTRARALLGRLAAYANRRRPAADQSGRSEQ